LRGADASHALGQLAAEPELSQAPPQRRAADPESFRRDALAPTTGFERFQQRSLLLRRPQSVDPLGAGWRVASELGGQIAEAEQRARADDVSILDDVLELA